MYAHLHSDTFAAYLRGADTPRVLTTPERLSTELTPHVDVRASHFCVRDLLVEFIIANDPTMPQETSRDELLINVRKQLNSIPCFEDVPYRLPMRARGLTVTICWYLLDFFLRHFGHTRRHNEEIIMEELWLKSAREAACPDESVHYIKYQAHKLALNTHFIDDSLFNCGRSAAQNVVGTWMRIVEPLFLVVDRYLFENTIQ